MTSRSKRVRPAGEERERGADVAGSVVEGAAELHLLVVDPERVDLDARLARQTAEGEHDPTRPHEPQRGLPGGRCTCRLDHDVGTVGLGGHGSEERRQRSALRSSADGDGTPTRVGDARAEHQPDRAEPEDRNGVARPGACPVDPVEATRERLGHRGDLGGEPGRHAEQVLPRDARRDEDDLGVGAVEEREEVLAERLLPACAGSARAARSRVGGDDPVSGRGVDPAELVPERARRRPEQHGMPSPKGLQVGTVGQRHLDLDEYVAVLPSLGARNGLDPDVAGAVKPQRPHGVKTTFSASRRRKSFRPSEKRSRGRTTGSGSSRKGRSAAASVISCGAAERTPTRVSSPR